MKILMATMAMDIGGAETHIVELCRELTAQGHAVFVASAGGVYVPYLEEMGVRHIAIPMKHRQVGEMAQAYRKLKKLMIEQQFDMVHAHARIPAFLCGLLHKKLKFPFVTTAHWVFRTGGGLRYLTKWGEGVVAVSQDIKQYLIDEYNYPADKIAVTINGINTDTFCAQTPCDTTITPTPHTVCHVSRLDEDRAQVAKQLVEITPALVAKIPDFSLIIVGDGNHFGQIAEQAHQINKQFGREVITLTGARTNISELVVAGDIFVGVSRAALEAMAAERLVIVAGNEGYQGIFTPEGLQVAIAGNFCCRGMEQSTPNALKQDIIKGFALSDHERTSLGQYGREVVHEHYSLARMASDCTKMYQQVTQPTYQVVISGYYGFENAGDDAILQTIHHQITANTHQSKVDIVVLSHNPAKTEEHYGLRAVHRLNLPAIVHTMKKSDALVSGGGSLIQDRTSTRSLLYYLGIIRLAQWMHKPVMLYANGIGPVVRPNNRKRVKQVLQKATVITLRDQNSADELVKIGIAASRIHVTADPVLNMQPAGHNRGTELTDELGITGDFFVVSVRNWKESTNFVKGLATVCDHLAQNYGMKALFVLMQPERDRETSLAVQRQMASPSYLLEGEVTPREIMAVIEKSKLCLAMRLHTLIFSAGVGVPLMGIIYDPKVKSYLAELCMPVLGQVESFDTQKAIAQVDDMMAQYNHYRDKVRERGQLLGHKACENEEILLNMLTKEAGKPK